MAASDHLSDLQFSSTRHDELGTTHWARANGTVVGHAMTNHLPGEPVELAAITVGADYQGHGVGHKLLDHVISHHSDSAISLHPSPFANQAMNEDQLRTFYGSHGFKQLKRPLRNGDDMIRRPPR